MMKEQGNAMRCVFSREQVEARVREIGAEINATYEGKPLVVICVLKGAVMFFSDLLKEITVGPEIDFVRLASYGDGVQTTKTVNFTKDVELSLKDKHILLVEDVIDSGYTMEFLLRQLAARNAASVKIAVLVDKHERREVAVTPDFIGFSLNEGFIVGYGLDYAERYRELPAIYEVFP